MNVCMYEFIYDAKCSEILISKLFPNKIIFIDFKLLITSDLNKSIKLGHSNPKLDQKDITWVS